MKNGAKIMKNIEAQLYGRYMKTEVTEPTILETIQTIAPNFKALGPKMYRVANGMAMGYKNI